MEFFYRKYNLYGADISFLFLEISDILILQLFQPRLNFYILGTKLKLINLADLLWFLSPLCTSQARQFLLAIGKTVRDFVVEKLALIKLTSMIQLQSTFVSITSLLVTVVR